MFYHDIYNKYDTKTATTNHCISKQHKLHYQFNSKGQLPEHVLECRGIAVVAGDMDDISCSETIQSIDGGQYHLVVLVHLDLNIKINDINSNISVQLSSGLQIR